MFRIPLITLCCCLAALATQAQSSVPAQLAARIPALMQRDRIPGLTIAYIENGRTVWTQHFGVANNSNGAHITDSSRFEAASLTKVVTAYMALLMAGSHQLDLDKPLSEYLGNTYDVGNDPRLAGVTARRTLTHTAGFPNWRSDSLLRFLFTPGEKFQYSGEGFVMLAKVMEKLTGKKYAELAKDSVFIPLGMHHSSMTFDSTLRALHVPRHNWLGNTAYAADYPNQNAAASLRTTAADYAIFLSALMAGNRLDPALHREMFTPHSYPDMEKMPGVAWGLGVGLDSSATGRYAWHWGDQGDSRALFVIDPAKRNGIVYFTNSANGLSPAADILAIAPGGRQDGVVKWVAYGKFDGQAEAVVRSIHQLGGEKAIQQHVAARKHKIGEDQMNMIGYELLRNKRYADAIAVFKQNTVDYPASANVWDSLAEGYMENGDKAQAIANYEKTLRMKPDNPNAVEMLKKLRGK